MAEEAPSNSGLLLFGALAGVLLLLLAVPQLLLYAAGIAAIGGAASLVLNRRESGSSDASSTVQLQQLPRRSLSGAATADCAANQVREEKGEQQNGEEAAAAQVLQPAASSNAVTRSGSGNDSSTSGGAFGSQDKQLPEQQAASDGSAGTNFSPAPVTDAQSLDPRNADTAAKSPAKQRSETPAELPKQPVPEQPAQRAAPAAKAGGAAGGAAILARLKAQRAQNAKVKQATQPQVTILYASQTGTAQEVARSVQASSAENGIKSKVMSCNELGWENLSAEKTPVIVIVASSTGDGDSPDNAAKFYATMKRKSQEKGQLKGISVTVLGLGDSNYTRFCHVPRTFRTRMSDLGASLFYKATDGDEVDGLEDIIDTWVDGLWPELQKQLAARSPGGEEQVAAQAAAVHSDSGKPNGAAAQTGTAATADRLEGVPALPACRVRLVWEDDAGRAAQVSRDERYSPSREALAHRDEAGLYSREAPFWAVVQEAAVMTAADSDRRVLHVGLDVSGSNMRYSPGDSIGVIVQNEKALVDGLLERLGAGGGRVFSVAPADDSAGGGDARLLDHLTWPCTLRAALLRGCDLTGAPRKSLLRLLAEHCADEAEKQQLLCLSSRGGREEYNAHVRDSQPSLLDLLKEFPSCSPPLDALLDALPALTPRLYSIASSPLQQPNQVDVALSVVTMQTRYGTKRGVATTWLDRLTVPLTSTARGSGNGSSGASEPLRVPVFLRGGGAFHPPADLSKPVVYVGPGTGVAPFRGFLQHRRQQLADFRGTPGEAWLFFGCRRESEDFLYRDDWQAFQDDGTLTHFHAAFSRAQADKVYVQALMRQQGAAVYAAIVQQGAAVLVCGDGAQMAKDVHAALTDILAEHGGASAEEAAAQLADLTKQQLYVRDIWS